MSTLTDTRSCEAKFSDWPNWFWIPVTLGVFIYISLFPSFLGEQATQVAKLTFEIDKKVGYLLGIKTEGKPVELNMIELTKISSFVINLLLWTIVVNFAVLNFVELRSSINFKLMCSALATASVPLAFLYKYELVNDKWDDKLITFVHVGGQFSPLSVSAVGALLIFYGGLWYFALRRIHANESLLRQASRILSIISIIIYILMAGLIAFLLPQIPTWIGSTNLLFFFAVLLLPFLIVLHRIRADYKFPIIIALLAWFLLAPLIKSWFSDNLGGRLLSREFSSTQELSSKSTNEYIRGRVSDVPVTRISYNDFKDWLRNRPDRAKFAGKKKYPVYILAAEGGGMYATMHLHYFLMFMEEYCPSFAHHVFAISSVSGGALGSLAHVSHQIERDRREHKQTNRCSLEAYPNPVKKRDGDPDGAHAYPLVLNDLINFWDTDIIAPIIGGGLFSELLNRFLPIDIPQMSRTAIVQAALQRGWRFQPDIGGDGKGLRFPEKCRQENFILACRSSQYWHPKGSAPALLFNTTTINGLPLVISNLENGFLASYDEALLVRPCYDFHLYHSSFASASFPLALPSWRVHGIEVELGIQGTEWVAGVDCEHEASARAQSAREANSREKRLGSKTISRTYSVVDGGYYDNSGLLAAYHLRKALIDQQQVDQSDAERLQYEVHIIPLGRKVPKKPYRELLRHKLCKEEPTELVGSAEELLAHASALISVRETLGKLKTKLLNEVEIATATQSYNHAVLWSVPANRRFTFDRIRREQKLEIAGEPKSAKSDPPPKPEDTRKAKALVCPRDDTNIAFYYATETRNEVFDSLNDSYSWAPGMGRLMLAGRPLTDMDGVLIPDPDVEKTRTISTLATIAEHLSP